MDSELERGVVLQPESPPPALARWFAARQHDAAPVSAVAAEIAEAALAGWVVFRVPGAAPLIESVSSGAAGLLGPMPTPLRVAPGVPDSDAAAAALVRAARASVEVDLGLVTAERGVLRLRAVPMQSGRAALCWSAAAPEEDGVTALSGALAHEFNNILQGVGGRLEMIELGVGDVSHHLTRARDALAVAAELTAQLVALTGDGGVARSTVRLTSLIRGLMPRIRATLPEGSVVAYDLADDVDTIQGCPEQLRRLVLNLVVNAGEALRETDGLVTVRVASANGQITLAVSDDGTGMSDEVRGRALSAGFSTKAVGRGLGLAAVSGIARAHGGQVGLCSTKGEGTTVVVTLPATPEEPAAVRPVGASRTVGMPTVLVIDDDAEVREVAALVLRNAGYRVAVAADGKAGIARFVALRAEGAIDAVLLDLIMPGMGGDQVLSQLTRIAPEVPVVLTSGYPGTEVQRRLGDQTPAAFIAKPARGRDIVRTMGEVIGRVSVAAV
jgi:two-component system, cell cycle sensor histidine kinase and response regulator CckA